MSLIQDIKDNIKSRFPRVGIKEEYMMTLELTEDLQWDPALQINIEGDPILKNMIMTAITKIPDLKIIKVEE